MAAYAGITFTIAGSAGDFDIDDLWPEQRVVVTPLANGGDDVQFMGRGSSSVKWPLQLASAADYATLLAAQGSTKRTLTKWDGSTVANVMLLTLSAPKPHGSGAIICDAAFKVGV